MFNSPFTKNMIWFEGVVENNNDPLKLGRVQVRMFGYHTEDKALIPTEDLHYAQVMHPITSAAMNGIGHTPALLNGTHVVGFFRDSTSCQDPVVMGSIGGIPQASSDASVGFSDPDSVYPKEDFLDEPDVSRHARGEESFLDAENDLTPKKRTQREESFVDKVVPTSDTPATENVSQPEIPYATEYPFNRVHETESGHVIEYDDTPGSERICITHKTGSFIEMHPDGTVTAKSVNENYKLVQADNTEIVLAKNNVHVGSDYNLNIEGNMNLRVVGDVNWHTGGNWRQVTVGTTNLTQTGAVTETLENTLTQTVSSSVSLTHSSSYAHSVSATLETISGGVQTIQGSQVLIN